MNKALRKISLFLIIVSLTLVLSSCGAPQKSNDIVLSADNCSTYFRITGSWKCSGNTYKGEKGRTAYDSVSYSLSAVGNDQYTYNNVQITVQIIVNYWPPKNTGSAYGVPSGATLQTITSEETIEIWNGEGVLTGAINAPSATKFLDGNMDWGDSCTTLSYDIIDVKGTATPKNS